MSHCLVYTVCSHHVMIRMHRPLLQWRAGGGDSRRREREMKGQRMRKPPKASSDAIWSASISPSHFWTCKDDQGHSSSIIYICTEASRKVSTQESARTKNSQPHVTRWHARKPFVDTCLHPNTQGSSSDGSSKWRPCRLPPFSFCTQEEELW